MPISNPVDTTGLARTTNGTYVGNNTVNRAIAHALGAAPRAVFILDSVTHQFYRLLMGINYVYYTSGPGRHAVTAKDVTNFYVGNAGSYPNSANATGATYFWVAVS